MCTERYLTVRRSCTAGNIWCLRRCLLHQFIGVTDRNRQVRAAKTIQNGEVHTDDLAIAIEERSAGTARGCRCVINNLVLQDISDVSLGGRWANEVLRRQLRNNLGYLVRVFRHFFCYIAPRASEDAFDSRGVANQDDWIARYTGFTPIIELQ